MRFPSPHVRVSTLMLLVMILAMAFGLIAQHRQIERLRQEHAALVAYADRANAELGFYRARDSFKRQERTAAFRLREMFDNADQYGIGRRLAVKRGIDGTAP